MASTVKENNVTQQDLRKNCFLIDIRMGKTNWSRRMVNMALATPRIMSGFPDGPLLPMMGMKIIMTNCIK